ncbi:hypothetical protein [Calycomorphotria hydatis]|uniref:Uncharacterized protein n=1 Tax=Calycomorphotria hydatis TaxID=2528027 RepID=A0A517TDA5_9PLAN|nr:hypothetical protein [Calycomorphotria hydatis]QDT66355.1 hypothetical protein V22_36210 [Calycomorphotria hydatis]
MSEEKPPVEQRDPLESFSMLETVDGLVRMLMVVIGALLLIVGAYLGYQVFAQLGLVIREGDGLEAGVERIAKIIDADTMHYKDQQKGVDIPIGRTVAMVCYGGWFLLWVWIPLALIRVAGSLLSLTLKRPTS